MTLKKINDKWFVSLCNGTDSSCEELVNFCKNDCKNCRLASEILFVQTWGKEQDTVVIDDSIVMAIISRFK